MGEFFKGRRRKLGVVALVMACVFTAGWVRSHAKHDLLFLPPVCILSSGNSAFAISQEVKLKNDLKDGAQAVITFDSNSFLSQRKFKSFDLVQTKIIQPRMIPYSLFVIPLTLLSAFLLLNKPRAAKSKKAVEPTLTEGI
jgi:hypothetical protein